MGWDFFCMVGVERKLTRCIEERDEDRSNRDYFAYLVVVSSVFVAIEGLLLFNKIG